MFYRMIGENGPRLAATLKLDAFAQWKWTQSQVRKNLRKFLKNYSGEQENAGSVD